MSNDFDIKQYEQYFIYDQPIPYKNLLISPVTIKDYMRFYTSINCLTIEKNKIPDIKIIKMSYLDFIFHLIEVDTNGQFYAMMLCDLLNLCCGIDIENIRKIKDEKDKINLIISVIKDDELIDIIIDGKDFDNIKNIILFQNIHDYDDSYIDPKVEAVLKEAEAFINRNKKKMASLEDQIVCVMLALHEADENKIHKLTLRKFSKILQRYDFKLHYEIYKTAEMSGMVTFKEGLDHWMTEIINKKYSETITEYDQFKNKMDSVIK